MPSAACRWPMFPGEFVAIMGFQRLGQKHADEPDWRAGTVPPAAPTCWMALTWRLWGADRLAEIRNEKIGFVFQGFNLPLGTTALENVECPCFTTGSA